MPKEPKDIERLVHEALETLGWNANAKEIANKVKRLNLGLPAEDEFSVLCGWLGQCNLIHKLDQQQYPVESKEKYQIPDLLAEFTVKDKVYSVCIEVKQSNKNVLSFTPDYLLKLKNYGKLIQKPILIAWKNKFGFWSLIPLDSFKKAVKNYNISFSDAMTNSLMGILVGDFSYTIKEGAGINIKMKKIKLLDSKNESNSIVENWKMVIDGVYYTDGTGQSIDNLSASASNSFLSIDLDEEQEYTDTDIIVKFLCKQTQSVFAHMALVRILSFGLSIRDERIHWRQYLSSDEMLKNVSDFKEGIQECLEKGIMQYIFDIMPQTVPEFISE